MNFFIRDNQRHLISRDLVRLKKSMLLEAHRLYESGLYQKLMEMAVGSLAALEGYRVIDRDDEMSELYSIIASANWKLLGEGDTSLNYLFEALRFNRGNNRAIELLREINGLRSDSAQLFSVGIEGKAERDGDVLPYVTSYEIIADDLAEARTFIVQFDFHKSGPDFKIDEAEILRAARGELKGICSCIGLIFYDEK